MAANERISESLSAEEVNRILTHRVGIGLYNFARALVISVQITKSAKRHICSAQQISGLRKLAHDFEKYGFRTFREIGRLSTAHLARSREARPLDLLPSEVHAGGRPEDLKYMGLDKLINRANWAADALEKYSHLKRGNYLDARSVVAASWGNLLERHRHEKWILLASLYEWFWARLNPWQFYRDLEPPGVEGETLENFLRSRHARYGQIDLQPIEWIPGDRASVSIVYLVEKLNPKGGVFFDAHWAWFDFDYIATRRVGQNQEITIDDISLPTEYRLDVEKKFGRWAADRLDEVVAIDQYWPPGLRAIFQEFEKRGIDLKRNSAQLIVFPTKFSPYGRYSNFYSPLL